MIETRKFNLWVKYFGDPKNQKCFGNAAQSALKAYGYDPDSQYNLACVTGSKNIRKYKVLGMAVAEEMGIGYKEFIKIGIKKMLEGNYDTWEKFGIRLGYFDEKPIPGIAIQNNFDFNDLGEAINKSRKGRGLPPI